MAVSAAAASELERSTLDAYQAFAASVERHFIASACVIERPAVSAPLLQGQIAVEPGAEDGIIEIADGLVHHWRGSAFIRHVNLSEVISVAQSYDDYERMYKPVVASRLLGRQENTFHTLMRVSKGVGPVSAVLDIASTVRYVRIGEGRVYASSNADRIVEIEDAGGPGEHALPPGEGSGYLWRARVLSLFVETADGVYVRIETVGLSRRFPRFLGFIIEPIARGLGKGSVVDSLTDLRREVLARRRARPPVARHAAKTARISIARPGT
jgi:hypothetical protein